MADDLCLSAKDSLIIKAPKKNPLLLRLAVLIFVTVCGVYICSVCLRQIGGRSLELLSSVEVVERPCELTNVEPLEKPFLHFPKPKSFNRGECTCNPVRYFAILSTQRSGSGWFETLLNSHVNISSNGEIFSVKVRRSNITTIVDTLDKIYNLDWFTSASKNECTAAVGLKWMLNQGLMQHHAEIVNYFNAKGVSVIFLFRRNLLHRMISVLANSYDQNAKLLNGTHKSHVHSHEEAEILAKYKPTVDTPTLVPNLKQLEDLVTKSLEYFKNTRHIILYYEDILKNREVGYSTLNIHEACIQFALPLEFLTVWFVYFLFFLSFSFKKLADVQHFLRVPRMELRSRQVKIHKGSLSSQVENWEDVKKTLQGTSYEKFLDQDYKL